MERPGVFSNWYERNTTGISIYILGLKDKTYLGFKLMEKNLVYMKVTDIALSLSI